MARPVVASKTLVVSDNDNIALAQALAGAGALLLNGDVVTGGIATLDTARRIGMASSGNDLGITFTVNGGDYAGNAISEVVTGASGATASTLQDFLTVSSVVASGAVAGTVSVGTTGVGSTQWFITDTHITPFEIGIGTELNSGTANWTIETTYDSPLAPMPIYTVATNEIPVPFGWPGLIGLAASASGVINGVVAAWRLTINSGTGLVEATAIQAGISN